MKEQKRMNENRKRILFLLAHQFVRALMAASLLLTRARRMWDIWSTEAASGS